MHTFTPCWTELCDESPSIFDSRFRSADDVIAYCQHDLTTVVGTRPELWHLNEAGQFVCCSSGSTLATLEWMAENPSSLLKCRARDVDRSCPDHWVIVAPRPRWLFDGKAIGTADIAAFNELRRWLWQNARLYILDYVAIDDAGHWWSLNELACGTTEWNPPAAQSDGCRSGHRPSTYVDDERDSA